MADIFVSYTSSDRDWAFWIGHELDALGYTPHIHEWELPAGGDIMKWMDERHQAADHILCVVSGAYLERPYSRMERRAAQWAAADDRPNFAIPVFVEPCKAPTLFATLKRCDLYGLTEEDARARLKDFLAPAAKSARGAFPGGVTASSPPPSSSPASSFPGGPSPPSNVLLVKRPPQAPEPCTAFGKTLRKRNHLALFAALVGLTIIALLPWAFQLCCSNPDGIDWLLEILNRTGGNR
jgi:TIR domain